MEGGVVDTPLNEIICSSFRMTRRRIGIFHGENPFKQPLSVLLIQLSISISSYAILHSLLNPLGQTTFLPQILAGLILGPCMGQNATFKKIMFPGTSLYAGDTFAYFGVIIFFFLVGVKMDFSLIRKPGKHAYHVGACTFLFPLSFTFFLAAVLRRSIPMESKMHESLFWVASFQSMSSSHVILSLLFDLKLMSSDLGRAALSSSIISGAFSVLWSTSVFTGKESTIKGNPQWMMLLMTFLIFAMLVFLIFVLSPLFLWMERNTIDSKSLRESYMCTIFMLLLGSAMFSEVLGQHFLYGPMFLGAVIPDGPPLGSAIITKLDTVVSNILLPVYFVITCSKLDFSLIRARNFWIILLLAFFAFFWKVLGAIVPSMWFKMSYDDALSLGLIMSIQGINDCLILERAMQLHLIDKEIFTIMILCVVLFAGTTSPLIKIIYKPSKRYTTAYKKRSIEDTDPKSELRLLGCVYHVEQTPSILNLIEALYPNPRNPICFYVIHLIDIAGRGAPIFLDHYQLRRPIDNRTGSEKVLSVLKTFQQKHEGKVIVFPFTAIEPYETMHNDVCSLAMDKNVSMVIVPFHKFWDIISDPTEELKPRSVQRANQNILKNAPCSVGILVDRAKNITTLINGLYKVGVVFIGGGDDREALALGNRMAKHPNIKLSVLHPIEYGINELGDDSLFIKRFLKENEDSVSCSYKEEVMKDTVSVVSMIRGMEKHMDLIIVGRRHDDKSSRMLIGLMDWNEFPELGYVGDLLATSDYSNVSVLVVQQQAFAIDDHILDKRMNPSSLPWNSQRVWPV